MFVFRRPERQRVEWWNDVSGDGAARPRGLLVARLDDLQQQVLRALERRRDLERRERLLLGLGDTDPAAR